MKEKSFVTLTPEAKQILTLWLLLLLLLLLLLDPLDVVVERQLIDGVS
jgi:hypothetical protein